MYNNRELTNPLELYNQKYEMQSEIVPKSQPNIFFDGAQQTIGGLMFDGY